MRYLYSLIRFVPEPATGEFVNIGAIAGSDAAREWAIRTVGNLARARRFEEGRGLLKQALVAVELLGEMVDTAMGELELDGVPRMSEAELLRISAEWRNIIQISAPLPAIAASAEDALDMIFDDMVIDPESRRRMRVGQPQLAKAIRRAFAEARIDASLREKPAVEAGGYEDRFEFAVANGRVVQLIRTWSLQTAGPGELAKDVHAWAWIAEKIRAGGGHVTVDDQKLDVPKDVRMVAVYAPADSEEGRRAIGEARHAAAEIRATLIGYNEVESVVRDARTALGT